MMLTVQATAQAVEEVATGTEQKKLWGGRFTGATDPLMEKFNESLPFDKRMWKEDLLVGSQQSISQHAALRLMLLLENTTCWKTSQCAVCL